MIDRIRSLDNRLLRYLNKDYIRVPQLLIATRLLWTEMTKGKISLLLILCLSNADKMTHQFNHLFSGVGTSSHYLTIENQELKREEQNELKAYKEQLKRDAEHLS